MKQQPHRLVADDQHHLGGAQIDRSAPVQFRLNGRTIQGFAGDTVLSAALASGIDTVGIRNGVPMALSARFAPPIALAALARDRQRALPMERTPVAEGAEFVTLASRGPASLGTRLRRLFRAGRSLEIDLDRPGAMQLPWIALPGEAAPPVDLIVVGGGVAGLTAALAGARAGLATVLLEATPHLGGHARLFGTLEGEDTPDHAIAGLIKAVTAVDSITKVTSAEVFAVRQGAARTHVVERLDGVPTARVVDYTAPRIVIATGAIERLPLFPGNRLPGVTGALDAFELAHRYGVWPGRKTLLATSSSPAYRLAMLATDAGLSLPRVIDSRPHPQSRFIEFSRAYGITQAPGTLVARVQPSAKGNGLDIQPRLALPGLERDEPIVHADRLIVCGGWQPDLTLWHMAGGASRWNEATHRLEPTFGPDGIALAGAAAGWVGRSACTQSGAAAVETLLGRPGQSIAELAIDPIYETPDGIAPAGAAGDGEHLPTYLDGGRRTIQRPGSARSRWPAWLPFMPRPPAWSLADTPQPLDIGDIASGVQLGAIPAASAGIVAQERVAMVAMAGPTPPPAEQPGRPPLLPAFLVGRFGDRGELWLVAPAEQRALEAGALIQADADRSDPLDAIGVVVRPLKCAAIALLDRAATASGATATVRDHGRAIPVRLVSVYREGMNLAAALGSGAGAP